MNITRKEKKVLFGKLTPVIKAALLALKSSEFTYKEITERTHLHVSRISEVLHDRNDVNEIFLAKLLAEGITDVYTLLSLPGLTRSEEIYLKNLAIYEDMNLRDEAAKLISLGEDPTRVLRDFRMNRYPESIGPA